MDYGQNKQSIKNPELFPASRQEKETASSPEQNTKASELASFSPERNYRLIGGKIISSGESPAPLKENVPDGLGIISESGPSSSSRAALPASNPHLNPATVHPEGDTISGDTLDALHAIENDYRATGDISSFYDAIRSAADTYQGQLSGSSLKGQEDPSL